MGRFFLNITILVLLLSSCGPQKGTREDSGPRDSSPGRTTTYAEKFNLCKLGELTLLNVFTPWQNADGTQFSYLLGKDPLRVPDSLSTVPFIRTPVKKTVIMSTTFIGFLDTLGVAPTITGVSGGRYIFDPALEQCYLAGKIREVGYDQQLNYELLLELDPDVVFLFGVQSGIVQTVNKLRDAGIPVVLCADYLEPHPLGRAEWIKFFAAFYEKQDLAESIFRDIAHQYDSLAIRIASGSRQRKIPEVMLGLPWKDTWYVAGGESFAAKLISDACGAYLFRDHNHAEAKPYDIEAVYARAVGADVWLNPGIAGSMDDILEHDPRFEKLDVFSKGAVYNNNKRLGTGGGNDYWESGVVRPDLILQDLALIFNGQPADSSDLFYYRQLR